MAPDLAKSAFQKGTRKFTKNWIHKISKKEPKRDYVFRGVYLKKPSKIEPWAQNGAPSLQEGSPGTQNTQKSSKNAPKRPSKTTSPWEHGGGVSVSSG